MNKETKHADASGAKKKATALPATIPFDTGVQVDVHWPEKFGGETPRHAAVMATNDNGGPRLLFHNIPGELLGVPADVPVYGPLSDEERAALPAQGVECWIEARR